jgi:hypothetical protein
MPRGKHMVTDNPRIRYWDNNYQEIPYCIQCGMPHPDNGKCLRRNKTQKESNENLLRSTDMQSSLRDRIAKVLNKHYPQTTGYQDELTDWCQCGLPRDHVADAVIAEIPELHWVIRYARTVSGVSDGKLVEPEHLPATQEKRRKKKKK